VMDAKGKQVVVIVGAGVAGLTCAKELKKGVPECENCGSRSKG